MRAQSGADVEHLRETPVGRRAVFAGRLLRVFEDTVRLPGGREAGREVVEHPGAVGVVAVAPDGRVVLVRQWRHAVGRALWEVPAGTRDPGEEPRATAERELREETGYGAGRWSALGSACVSPGYSDEVLHFFLAEDLTAGPAQADADESLDVGLFTPGEAAALAAEGSTDCKTLGALALAGLLPALRGEAPR